VRCASAHAVAIAVDEANSDAGHGEVIAQFMVVQMYR
jgi:hypothetical protein